ncbi:MAG: hypothetical protein A3G91_05040 [Omnitrophica WOR_2 bacterium RIFCSPLOWO2_12_FULL_50_9]|nr:MAG: hypothetical protein A3D87_06780 [Omnitrophica WOR_2 bacterium RIFCSPHIGHO2_02_FULL_50_17]OGX42885.1 MAG: hypothetical protein A3G91_05040 [Omnitrophica WOR_2 bacterium RIFCSPLOWO2_12_FULL_50_9]
MVIRSKILSSAVSAACSADGGGRQDERKDVRVRENKRISWRVKDSELLGYGRVRDISTSGMLLEINSPVNPTDQSIFTFDANLQNAGFIPSSGRLIWHMKKRYFKNQYLCGIQFADTPEAIVAKLSHRTRKGTSRLASADKFKRDLNTFLTIVVTVLTGYMLYLSYALYRDLVRSYDQLFRISVQQAAMIRNYQRRYQETSLRLAGVSRQLGATTRLYQESRAMLTAAAKELSVIKTVLSETETMLSLAYQENLQLKQEMESVPALRTKDVHLTNEIKVFQNQLTDYAGDVHSIQEGNALVDFYHQKIRDVRSRIRQIKRETWTARIAAFQERDRIRLMLGNNGYFFRDGQIVRVDREQYQAASGYIPSAAASPPASRKAKVDVTIFQK